MHVQDVNGSKGGTDIKCSIEARLAGVKATAATHEDNNFQTAVSGAFEKLNHTIEHTLGRIKAK